MPAKLTLTAEEYGELDEAVQYLEGIALARDVA